MRLTTRDLSGWLQSLKQTPLLAKTRETTVAAQFRVLGIYALTALLLAKFVCVPLYQNLEAKKKILADYSASVKDLGSRVSNMTAGEKEVKSSATNLAQELYPKEKNVYAIQSEMLRYLTGTAERRGLTLQTFEIPPPAKDKVITEISIVFKQKGPTRATFDFLQGTSNLVYPPDFLREEFTAPYTVEKLCAAITADGYRIQLKSPDSTLDRLNEYLKISDFYDIVQQTKNAINFSPQVAALAEQTKSYRKDVVFGNLTIDEQTSIMKLNRKVLEEAYATETPKRRTAKIMDMKALQLDRSGNDLTFAGTFSVYRLER